VNHRRAGNNKDGSSGIAHNKIVSQEQRAANIAKAECVMRIEQNPWSLRMWNRRMLSAHGEVNGISDDFLPVGFRSYLCKIAAWAGR
jgi:hypothetical protein